MQPDIVLAITGASGAIYAVRLLEVLIAAGRNVQLTISPSGKEVIEQELGREVDLNAFDLEALAPSASAHGAVRYYHYKDFMAPMASGSALTAGMVVCPCSGGTLSAIAHGASTNLIHRAADVHLKERRPLILVPRETPLSLVHIENMRLATLAGAVIAPASPGFYHRVRGVNDLVDFVVARICDQLKVEHKLGQRWGEAEPAVSEQEHDPHAR